MEQKDLVRLARRRAAAKFGFLIHLTVFVAVNAFLYFINQRTSPNVSWFAFPLGGWAIGLAIHEGDRPHEPVGDAEWDGCECDNHTRDDWQPKIVAPADRPKDANSRSGFYEASGDREVGGLAH